jgi:hypothetical protein
MSQPVPASLYRIAAVAGCGSAAILLVNAAKRAEVIPTSAVTQLVAPLAQTLALALVTALYLAFGRRAGMFGLVAYLLNAFALSALVGVEFVINLVFKDLPAETVQTLRAGALGIALTAASMLFLLGTLAFVTAMLGSRELPSVPLVLYALGAIPVSFRAFVPEAALDLGLVVLAAGIAWLAVWLFTRSNHIGSWTTTNTRARPPARCRLAPWPNHRTPPGTIHLSHRSGRSRRPAAPAAGRTTHNLRRRSRLTSTRSNYDDNQSVR